MNHLRRYYVYVQQYDSFWRLHWHEWTEICRAAQLPDFDGYTLPHNRRLQRRPRCIAVFREPDAAPSYYSRAPTKTMGCWQCWNQEAEAAMQGVK